MKTQGLILQGLSLSEFESLLDTLIAKRITEVAISTKQVIPTQEKQVIYLTRKEAAHRLNITPPTLKKYVNLGFIQSHRLGNRVLFREDDIIKAVEAVQLQKFRQF